MTKSDPNEIIERKSRLSADRVGGRGRGIGKRCSGRRDE